MMDEIKHDFEEIYSRLRRLDKIYNPQGENLHVSALERADAGLYSELLVLAQEGLETIRKHSDYFSRHALYDDGMFWYNFLLMTSSAASRVSIDKTQRHIPEDAVKKLTEVLVDISEFSTVPPGNIAERSHEASGKIGYADIAKRNHEVLGNTLWVFYSKHLIDLVRKRNRAIGLKKVMEFVEWTIDRVEQMVEKDGG